MIGIYIALGIISGISALILLIVVRTIIFKAHPIENNNPIEIAFDKEKAVSDLSEMIKCKTISRPSRDDEDNEEFEKLKKILPNLFPNIYEKCEYEELDSGRVLLYKYKGKTSTSPSVLMAHFDVVPADEEKWTYHPFGGEVKDGFLWGRGTIDTKITMNAAMQALEKLISEGFIPENDIYLAFSGSEETTGNGAVMTVDKFEKAGIIPGFVLDEGGAVVKNAFPGVTRSSAMIGIAEKGMLIAKFSCESCGGHASCPKPDTPIKKLSSACIKIENQPFRYRICEATSLMFKTLAPYSNFLYRMIFANLWFFGPVLNSMGKRKGGETNALIRTTCAFTQMQGSDAFNVIPTNAEMTANLRILPGETQETAIEYLNKVINDDSITIYNTGGMQPSIVSDTECEAWNKISETISETWPGTIISPYLMFACSDSRHWGRLTDKIYRFSPISLTDKERATIHGNDEKIHIDNIVKSVEFYIKLIKKL